jgi:hypothetical protein
VSLTRWPLLALAVISRMGGRSGRCAASVAYRRSGWRNSATSTAPTLAGSNVASETRAWPTCSNSLTRSSLLSPRSQDAPNGIPRNAERGDSAGCALRNTPPPRNERLLPGARPAHLQLLAVARQIVTSNLADAPSALDGCTTIRPRVETPLAPCLAVEQLAPFASHFKFRGKLEPAKLACVTFDDAKVRLLELARSHGGVLTARDVVADSDLSADPQMASAAAHALAGSTNVFGTASDNGWFPYHEITFTDLR